MPQDTELGPGPDPPYSITFSITSLFIRLTSLLEDNTEMHDVFETPISIPKAMHKILLPIAKLADQLHTAAAAIVISQSTPIVNESLSSL